MATLEKIASVSAQVVLNRYGERGSEPVLFYHAESLTKLGSADPEEIEAYFDVTEKIAALLFDYVCDINDLDPVKVAQAAHDSNQLPWFFLDDVVEGMQKEANPQPIAKGVAALGKQMFGHADDATRVVRKVVSPPPIPQNVGGRRITPTPKQNKPTFPEPPGSGGAKAAPQPKPTPQQPGAQAGAGKGQAAGTTGGSAQPQPQAATPTPTTQGPAQQQARRGFMDWITGRRHMADGSLSSWSLRGIAQNIGETKPMQFLRGAIPGAGVGGVAGGALGGALGGAVGLLSAPFTGGMSLAAVPAFAGAMAAQGAGIGAGAWGALKGIGRLRPAGAGGRGALENVVSKFRSGWNQVMPANTVAHYAKDPTKLMNMSAQEMGNISRSLGNQKVLQTAKNLESIPANAIRQEADGAYVLSREHARQLGLRPRQMAPHSEGFVRVSGDPRIMALQQAGADANTARMLADPSSRSYMLGEGAKHMQDLSVYAGHSDQMRGILANRQSLQSSISRAEADLARAGKGTPEAHSAVQEIERLKAQMRTLDQQGNQVAAQLGQQRGFSGVQQAQVNMNRYYGRANPVTGTGAAAEVAAAGSSADEIARIGSSQAAAAESAAASKATQAAGAEAGAATQAAGSGAGAPAAASTQAAGASAAPGSYAHMYQTQQALNSEAQMLGGQIEALERKIIPDGAFELADPVQRAANQQLIQTRQNLMDKLQGITAQQQKVNADLLTYSVNAGIQPGVNYSQQVVAAQQGGGIGGAVQGAVDKAKEVAAPALEGVKDFWATNKSTLIPLGLLGGGGYMGLKTIEALNRPANYAPQGY